MGAVGMPHFFERHAVADGGRRTRAAVADGHDDGVALGFHFGPELGIVVGQAAGFHTIFSVNAGHVFLKPIGDLMEKVIGAGESVVDQEDGFAVERIDARGHGDELNRGRHAAGVERGDFSGLGLRDRARGGQRPKRSRRPKPLATFPSTREFSDGFSFMILPPGIHEMHQIQTVQNIGPAAGSRGAQARTSVHENKCDQRRSINNRRLFKSADFN